MKYPQQKRCKETFTIGLPNNFKDFANKRQEKHTSVLEPASPIHTLEKHVDAKDIAYDKIQTHELTLEVNNFTKQLRTQILDSSQQKELMFTQTRG